MVEAVLKNAKGTNQNVLFEAGNNGFHVAEDGIFITVQRVEIDLKVLA